MSHTPGPWFTGDIENTAITLRSPAGRVLYRGHPEFTEADARLIAAAPDLLAELKSALAVIEEALSYGYLPGGTDRELEEAAVKIRAAIAKTEGK